MFSNIISWSTAAVGGTPFRSNKCTALGSAGKGAAAGAAAGGAPGALVGGALGVAGSLISGLFGEFFACPFAVSEEAATIDRRS